MGSSDAVPNRSGEGWAYFDPSQGEDEDMHGLDPKGAAHPWKVDSFDLGFVGFTGAEMLSGSAS